MRNEATNPLDFIGKKFSMLTIIKYLYCKQLYKDNGKKAGRRYYFKCKCDCGNEHIVELGLLKQKLVKSCGCLKVKEIKRKREQRKTYINHIASEKANNNSQSGVRGVSFRNRDGLWAAQLMVNGVLYVKTFISINDAIAYRKELEETYFKPVINEFKANLDNPTTK